MAAIISKTSVHSLASGPGGDPMKIVIGTFAFDSSYPTGGEAFDISAVLPDIRFISFEPTAGYTFVYDASAKKVKAYRVPAITAAFTGSALAGHKHGVSTYSDADVSAGTPAGSVAVTGSEAALAEVGAGVDLASALASVPFVALGF